MLTLRQSLAIRGRQMLSNVGMILGIIMLLIFFEAHAYAYKHGHDGIWSSIIAYFWLGYVAVSCICAGQIMKPLGKKTTAMSLLMLPASNLEKYLSQAIICVVLPPILFFIGMEAIDFLRVTIVGIVYPEADYVKMVPLSRIFGCFQYDGVNICVVLILLVQSCFALGSSIWPKRAARFTFFALIALLAIYTVWAVTLVRMLDLHMAVNNISMTENISDVVSCVILACALLNYVVAYFRFKEAEIINSVLTHPRMDFKENSKPIYQQIADRMCDDVMAGVYKPLERIPSVREYAAMVQVNANTVMRSYDYLTSKDIIFNKRGIGFFISPNAAELISQLKRETFFNDEKQYFFSRLSSMNVSAERLAELYAEYLASNNIKTNANAIQS